MVGVQVVSFSLVRGFTNFYEEFMSLGLCSYCFLEVLDMVESRLFMNDADNSELDVATAGKVPYESTIAFANGHFRIAGELMASSIVQGGPAPDFLAPWVYNYICSGLDSILVVEDKVKDPSTREVLRRVSCMHFSLIQKTITTIYQQHGSRHSSLTYSLLISPIDS